MTKILYIHPSLELGGAEKLRLLTLKHIKKEQYDITVCCIEKKGEIGKQIEKLGYKVVCLNRSPKPYNFLVTLSLLNLILKNRFDIVQTSLFNANFHGRIAAALARVPIIISEEHSEHYQYNSIKFLPYILADRILSRFTDKILCCSKSMVNSISKKENIPVKKIFPLINAIEHIELKREKEKIKIENGYLKTEIIIGNIASISPRKGQEYLIKAFAKANKIFPESRLIIIGKEHRETKEKLIRLANEINILDKIKFMGKRNDALELLSIMDLLVISSIHEGIPLVILEAMFLGIPVVSTDVGGIAEVITDNYNGSLTHPGDSESLSLAIIELLKDSEKRSLFSERGLHTVSTKFNPKTYIKKLSNIYTDCLGLAHKYKKPWTYC